MRYLDICSGISAPTVGWRELGFTCAGYSEIEAAPRSILIAQHGATAVDWDHRHTAGSNVTPLFGDFTKIEAHHVGPIELLVGGTPCQSFSIAGLRGGMDDERGNLALEYLRLADRLRPRWLVWENVPGVLSSNGGRDFGSILGGMGELGYGFAYRVLDAQFFGVPQRRRRVFVVGYLGDWRRAAAVLFERHSLQGHSAPRREAGQSTSVAVAPSLVSSGRGVERAGETRGQDPVVACRMVAFGEYVDDGTASAMKMRDYKDATDLVAHPAMAFKASHFTRGKDGAPSDVVPPLSADADKGDQDALICFSAKDCGGDAGPISPTLRAGGFTGSHANAGVMPAIAFPEFLSGTTCASTEELSPALGATNPTAVSYPIAIQAGAVRENPESGPDGVGCRTDGNAYTLEARAEVQAIAFDTTQITNPHNRSNPKAGDPCHPLAAGAHAPAIAQAWAVRRLTPRECERLQGFPDDFTLVVHRGKLMADGPRYKALGNSMAVPVLRWIGERIVMVDKITRDESEAA